jgi:hypothetical protein
MGMGNGGLNSAQEAFQVVLQFMARAFEIFLSSASRWHFLYFFPLPHQQLSFLPGLFAATRSSVGLIHSRIN